MDAQCVVLGWPPDGPTLRLDYRRFSYAGKFVMSNTGKAVVRAPTGASDDEVGVTSPPEPSAGTDDASGVDGDPRGTEDGDETDRVWDDDVLAAAAFNEDRTDPAALWIRYVTVRRDRRGAGLGPRLAAFVVDRAADRGYERVRIAVNNPFAYEALSKAGFAFTGERTGLAELVLERPAARPAERDAAGYRAGLDAFREREWDADAPEPSFLAAREDADPPRLADAASGSDETDAGV